MVKSFPCLTACLRAVALAVLFAASLLAPMSPAAHATVPLPAPGVDPNFYKFGVTQAGMHKLTYETLAAAGLPVATLDPSTFQLFEAGAQIGREIVDADLSGGFTPGDYLLFYARPVDTYFTATNLYWLTFGVGAGLSIAGRTAAPQGGLPTAATFTERIHLEQNKTWQRSIPVEGQTDRWYWELYLSSCLTNQPGSFTTTTAAPGLATGVYSATLTPRLRGFPDAVIPLLTHTAIFDVNGTTVGQGSFVNTEEFLATFSFAQSLLSATGNTLRLTAPACPAPGTSDLGLVNSFDLTYQRTYSAPLTGQFSFGVDSASPVNVTLTNVTDPTTAVFDITDPQQPVRLNGAGVSAAALQVDLSFAHTLAAPARYIAASPAQLLTPAALSPDTPSNLRSPLEGADWIAITSATLQPAAERLATHRRDFQKLRTAVVDVQDIYDEFNGGLPDQEAIRTFVRYAYENWPRPAPQYVLLMGDGHYDPRNFLGLRTPGPYHIPPYLAAVDPVDGVTAADNRYVAYDPAPGEYPPPFMALGRLPANTLAEANVMVDKTIGYETTPVTGEWSKHVLFVADDADNGGDFPVSADRVYTDTTLLPADYTRERMYLYVTHPNATSVTDALVNGINSGALFVNYHGHGSQQRWSGEPVFKTGDLTRLTNSSAYPIMLPMTCLEGFFINPESTKQALGESIVRKANGGAVASWSPTGKGIANGHDRLYEAFYHAVFGMGMTELGLITDYAKQVLHDSDSRFKDLIDTYILFGDPALTIAVPAPNVWVQKALTPDVPLRAGDAVTYTLTYGNSGDKIATGVALTDVLPTALYSPTWSASDPAVTARSGYTLAWNLPALAPGASGVITLTAWVNGAYTGTALSNVASITTDWPEKLADRDDNESEIARGLGGPTALLSGQIYADANGNGQLDAGSETGIPNITLTILNAQGGVAGTAMSDGQGLWSLELPLGTYTITAPANTPGGYQLNTDVALVVTLAAEGVTVQGNNFGYVYPTGLEPEYFTATAVANGVRLDWGTRSEDSILGFHLTRATDPFSFGGRITPADIPAVAPPGEGAAYTFTDLAAPTNGRIYYWLWVHDRAGGESVPFGPAIVVRGHRIFAPLILKR